MKLIIDIDEEILEKCRKKNYGVCETLMNRIINSTLLTPDTLADLLMEERIRGELKQDICYSRDIVDNVECNLTVDIIDHRPCYCGAELREVWRESEG